MGDDKSSSSSMTSRERDRELLIPVCDAITEDDSDSNKASAAAIHHHSGRETLKDFIVGAEVEIRSLTLLYSNVGKNAEALAFYFGEDHACCPFEQGMYTSDTSDMYSIVSYFRT